MKRNGWSSRVVAVLAVLLALVVSGCAAGGGMGDFAGGEAPMPAMGGQPETGEDVADAGSESDRMIIRSKVLRMEVEDTPAAITQIRELTREHAGNVTDMQVATAPDEWVYHYGQDGGPVGDGSALRGWVTVRVPTASFEEFVAEVSAIGEVKYQSEATEDVTQQHVDLSARLENLRAQEERLREFFEAAADVDDMLSVEKELGRVRGEIESLDAQVKWLERQAAMATISVELVEPRAIVRPTGDSWGFVAAITDGVRGAASLLTSLLTILIATAPLWILALVLFFPARAWLRRRRKARDEERTAPRPEPAKNGSRPAADPFDDAGARGDDGDGPQV